SSSPRSATLTIADKTFTVMQDGVSCATAIAPVGPVYAPLPNSASFDWMGGTGSITVSAPADCVWTAMSNDRFLDIAAGGTGPGTITYTVAVTAVARSGTLSVAGRLFTVFQGPGFIDVQAGHQFFNFIGKLAARGVTRGCAITY